MVSDTRKDERLIPLIETHYLPSVAYFCALHDVNAVVLEKHERYIKQSYRNRTYIVSAQGKEKLIVPLTFKHGKVLITDVRVDYGQKWLNQHWRAIQSGYGKSAFFEYYSEDLERALFRKTVFLYDLNIELLSMCLKWLKRDVEIKESVAYEKAPAKPILDLRSAINFKKEENLGNFYRPVNYHQVFGNTFVANASIVDLIFSEGPGAAQIVEASAVAKMNK
jgi:WbqC-like protein family